MGSWTPAPTGQPHCPLAEMWSGLTQAHFPSIGPIHGSPPIKYRSLQKTSTSKPKVRFLREKKKKKKRKSLLFLGLVQMVHAKVAGSSRMDWVKGWFTRAMLGRSDRSRPVHPGAPGADGHLPQTPEHYNKQHSRNMSCLLRRLLGPGSLSWRMGMIKASRTAWFASSRCGCFH